MVRFRFFGVDPGAGTRIGGSGVIPPSDSKSPLVPVSFVFTATGTTTRAYYNIASKAPGAPVILPALGRIRLRLYDNTIGAWRPTGAWSGYFVNSGYGTTLSPVTGLVVGRNYTAYYSTEPDPSVADSWSAVDHTAFFTFTLTSGNTDEPVTPT